MHNQYVSTSSAKDYNKNYQAPLRPTKFGAFIGGLLLGALIASLTIFVVSVSGPFAGVALIIGTAIILATAVANMGDDQ